MGFATSQNFRYEKSDSMGVKLQYLETAQPIVDQTTNFLVNVLFYLQSAIQYHACTKLLCFHH